MADDAQKTSAQLEMEVEAQRNRVESTIGQIQDRLSPGQMVDELIGYAKNNGGGDFIANLGRSVTSNPIPVALLGVSLAWLMARPGNGVASSGGGSSMSGSRNTYRAPGDDIGYATVTGGVRHLGHVAGEAGERYSEFADETGKKFRALTDTAGNRAGHFVDDAGQTFRGFKSATGQRVSDIRDQGGTMLDAATGWASDTWRKAGDAMGNARDSLGGSGDRLSDGVSRAGDNLQRQADQMSRTALDMLHEQPLVGGALAFAVGAAIGAALPHTDQEDEMFGETADNLKQQAGEMAGQAYEQGRQQAADLYQQATDKAADLYDQVKPDAKTDTGTGTGTGNE